MTDEFEYTSDSRKAYTRLDDLEKKKIATGPTKRLEYILKTLNEADELNGPLCWQTELWEGCTVEELLGGLIEAERFLLDPPGQNRYECRDCGLEYTDRVGDHCPHCGGSDVIMI